MTQAVNVQEVIADVAASHRTGCGCTWCQAAAGKEGARAAVIAGLVIGGAGVIPVTSSREDRRV